MFQEVLDFLKKREPKLCVLATSSLANEPESAVMGYAVSDDLSIICSTDRSSRKWNNLKQNSKVAITFGWGFGELNIQYSGLATLVESGEELKKCEDIYFASHQESLEFKGTPETGYIKIKPTWIRLSDYSSDPPRIEEKNY